MLFIVGFDWHRAKMHDQTAVQLLNFKAGLAPYAQPEGCPPTVLVQLHYPPRPQPPSSPFSLPNVAVTEPLETHQLLVPQVSI